MLPSTAAVLTGSGVSIGSALYSYFSAHMELMSLGIGFAGLLLAIGGFYFKWRKHRTDMEYHNKRMRSLDEHRRE